jgi:hypothetical protein
VRPVVTRFGSFAALIGTAVHAKDWWIRVATGVALDGTPMWRRLSDYRATVERLVRATDSDYGTSSWVECLGPLALQCPASVFSSPFLVGLVAARVEEAGDIAYPFILRGDGGQAECGFSSAGPSLELQDSILISLAFLLLNSARIERAATRTPDAG